MTLEEEIGALKARHKDANLGANLNHKLGRKMLSFFTHCKSFVFLTAKNAVSEQMM